MRRGLQIIALGLVVAGLGYGGIYFAGTARSRQMLQSPQPELEWLKQEYHLDAAEFARISRLHNAYLPRCATHCRRIDELNRKLALALAATSSLTPEIKTLLTERARERADCQAEMLEHFFEVSRTMPADQGRRYLAWVQEQTCLQEPAMMHHAESVPVSHH